MRNLLMLMVLALCALALADGPSVVIINGRSMAPLRYVSETLGASVTYNSATKGISFTLEYRKVDVTVGSTTAVVHGQQQVLDTAPVIIAGVTYVPVRFIAVSCGADVQWVSATRQVKIIHPGSGKKIMLFVYDGPGKPRKTTINREPPRIRHGEEDRHEGRAEHGRGHGHRD